MGAALAIAGSAAMGFASLGSFFMEGYNSDVNRKFQKKSEEQQEKSLSMQTESLDMQRDEYNTRKEEEKKQKEQKNNALNTFLALENKHSSHTG